MTIEAEEAGFDRIMKQAVKVCKKVEPDAASSYKEDTMRFSAKQRKMLIRIVLGAVLLIIAVLLPFEGIWRFLIFLVPYLIVGYAPLLKAGRNILHGQIFDENFLMALATIGALALGEYPEAVAVMLFYQVGELFENVAVGRSRASIRALMEIRPDTAAVKRNGIVTVVTPEEVEAGEIIVVARARKFRWTVWYCPVIPLRILRR